MSERGTYGKSLPSPGAGQVPKKRGGLVAIGAVIAIAVAIYAFSPGAIHYYKHGKLPN